MLFMAVFNYAPEDRDEVLRRGLGHTEKSPGVEIMGEWFDVSGHRVFRLFEAKDEAELASSVFNWSDLGETELIPIMETEKALKLFKKTRKR